MTVPADLELDARGRRLRAGLAAVLVRDNAPELRLVRDWLNSWSGLGLIIVGLTHQGWDVQTHGLRRWGLAGQLLPGGHRAIPRRRHRVGADAVAGGAAGGGWMDADEASKQNPDKEDREMASTKDVLDHHLKCFGGGDLTGILSDYAPGAVLFTPDGALRGLDAIRPLFQAMIAEFAKPGAAFSMKQQFVEGDYAYILWTAETADNVYEMGTDTFVMRDSKIVAQSFAAKITPKG